MRTLWIAAALSMAPPVEAQTTTPAPSPSSPTAPCADEAHHQFDFWVGKWDVYQTGKDALVAHSLIESLYGGCGVRENWMPLKGTGGGSLNIYVPEEKHWEQFWIDSGGSRAHFIGGWNGKAMKGTALFPQCGFSSRAIAILDRLGAKYETVDVLQDPEIRAGIKEYSDWPTIPQLYVKGEFVGGSDIMMEMFESGELQQLLGAEAS